MKKKVAFAVTLSITVILLAVCFVPSFIGATSGRSALCVLETVAIDIFMSGDSYVAPEKTDKKIENRRKKNASYTPPDIYQSLYSFRTENFEGFDVCYFGEKYDDTVIYFHGGSFMWQPLILHYAYCDALSKKLSARVIMPLYPKAPQYTYTDVMEWLYRFYGTVPTAKMFIGDSAGGGMLLSFSQYLVDRGKVCPEKLVAFSPLLDASLDNNEIEKYAPLDPMLNRADLQRKLTTYIGDGDAKDPYVSPMFCDFSKLGEVTIIVGTREIMYPDNALLDEKLTKSGIKHNFYSYENQIHVFPIYPMQERTVILNLVERIYNS